MSAEQLTLGEALRNAALAQVEEATDEWQRATVDQAIRACADTGRRFSANDVRPLLPPGVRPALVGARFMAASRRKQILPVALTPSTEPGTHAHRITVWVDASASTADTAA